MTSDTLYRVKKEDFPKLEQLLIKCFEKDPLYVSMIPDEDIRKRLMPELFKCDLNEFYETCEIFLTLSNTDFLKSSLLKTTVSIQHLRN